MLLGEYRPHRSLGGPGLGDLQVLRNDAGEVVLMKRLHSFSSMHKQILSQMGKLHSNGFQQLLPCTQPQDALYLEFSRKSLEDHLKICQEKDLVVSEADLLGLLKMLLETGSLLEQIGEFHPSLTLQNIFRLKDRFKLINPYVFDAYIEETICGSSRNSSLSRQEKRKVNLVQAGIIVLAMGVLTNEAEIKRTIRSGEIDRLFRQFQERYSVQLAHIVEDLVSGKVNSFEEGKRRLNGDDSEHFAISPPQDFDTDIYQSLPRRLSRDRIGDLTAQKHSYTRKPEIADSWKTENKVNRNERTETAERRERFERNDRLDRIERLDTKYHLPRDNYMAEKAPATRIPSYLQDIRNEERPERPERVSDREYKRREARDARLQPSPSTPLEPLRPSLDPRTQSAQEFYPRPTPDNTVRVSALFNKLNNRFQNYQTQSSSTSSAQKQPPPVYLSTLQSPSPSPLEALSSSFALDKKKNRSVSFNLCASQVDGRKDTLGKNRGVKSILKKPSFEEEAGRRIDSNQVYHSRRDYLDDDHPRADIDFRIEPLPMTRHRDVPYAEDRPWRYEQNRRMPQDRTPVRGNEKWWD
jgi:hypothetical protein